MALDTASPVTESTGSGSDLGALSSQELGHWRQTGELPSSDAQNSTPKAESSPAEPAAQDVSTDTRTPPASEPGTPKTTNASTRLVEVKGEVEALRALLKERHELRRELERDTAPSPQTPKADSSSAPTIPTLAEVLERPDVSQPMLPEGKFWELYPEATVGDFAGYVAEYKIAAKDARDSQHQQKVQRTQPFQEQLSKTLAERPDFWQQVDPRVIALTPIDILPPGTTPTLDNVMAQEIITSPQAIALIEHLSAHADTLLPKLRSLPTAAAVIREIGRIEARLEGSSVPPAAPAALPVSLAPPPPATLGKKPGQPADELSEAIRQGDFARYRELQNRKEMKRA